jgi:predicted transcriptional regulator
MSQCEWKLVSINHVLKTLSDDKTLVLLDIVALSGLDKDALITKLGLSRKQYYSRIRSLTNSSLITRQKGKYYLTSFGKIVYDVELMIEKAVENYWKLKALDSFELSSSAGSQLPAEEYNRVMDTLMDGNDEIKDILRKYNNKSDIAAAQKEKVYTQHLIPSRSLYE